MNWTQAVAMEMVVPRMNCSLIIVGEAKEGLPFFYEDNFTLQKLDANQMVVTLQIPSTHPLESLDHVCFIEFSFSERGVLYYGFVDVINMETKRNVCTLTLTCPQELSMFQNRKFSRIQLTTRTPLTCRIVGVRKTSAYQGVAFTGHIQDISGGGLSFITNARIFYPLFMELSFVLPDCPQTFVVNGEIVRVSHLSNDSYQIAVEFRNIPESMTHQIDQYCSNCTQ